MSGNEKAVFGALAGIAIGATLGILFAPDKGSATRDKIAKKSKGLVSDMESQFNEFIKTVTQKFEELKSEATNVPSNGHAKDEDKPADVASSAKQ